MNHGPSKPPDDFTGSRLDPLMGQEVRRSITVVLRAGAVSMYP
jgi:hypothetical protein